MYEASAPLFLGLDVCATVETIIPSSYPCVTLHMSCVSVGECGMPIAMSM